MTAWRFTPTPACEHPDCGELAVLGTAWGGWRCANHRREDTSEEGQHVRQRTRVRKRHDAWMVTCDCGMTPAWRLTWRSAMGRAGWHRRYAHPEEVWAWFK